MNLIDKAKRLLDLNEKFQARDSSSDTAMDNFIDYSTMIGTDLANAYLEQSKWTGLQADLLKKAMDSNTKMREALEWYADDNNFALYLTQENHEMPHYSTSKIYEDLGERAREALKECE